MRMTVNFSDFENAFSTMGRANQFPEKLYDLFEYLEQYEEEIGEEIELDVVALCCEYSEFENMEDFRSQYGEDYETLRDIENETVVIGWEDENSPFIIQNF